MSIQEFRRLETLARLNIMDSAPEAQFDSLTALAATMFDVPIVLISLIDDKRQWFKSRFGLDISEAPRGLPACEMSIHEGKVLVIKDARSHPEFKDHHLVTGPRQFRFCASAPIILDEIALGTVCLLDSRLHPEFGDPQVESLRLMAMTISEMLRARCLGQIRQEELKTLKSQTQKLELVEAVMKVGHWRADLRTRQCRWSASVYHIHGYGDLTVSPDLDDAIAIYHPADRVAIYECIETAISTHQPFKFRKRLIRANDGAERHVDAAGICEFDAQDEPIAIYGIIQDVTEEVEQCRALERSAKVEADFLATMSHEIRTPLTSIIGFSGLLRDLACQDETIAHFARRIYSAGQGLLSLTNDILDHARLEEGRIILEPSLNNVAEIVEDVVNLLSVQAQSKSLLLNTEIDPYFRNLVYIDEVRLRQILYNLVGNAIKFTDAGEVRVSVTAKLLGLRPSLVISIKDTGRGIAAEDMPRLFKRFSKVEGRVPGSGTGLGLVICQQLVSLMGGEINIESTPGKGSIFHITLPLEFDLDSLFPQEVNASAPGRTRHILVVDDHVAIRELLRVMLEPQGYKPDLYSNGADALKACLQTQYDLILMDVNMPVMDGLLATAAIRQSSELNCRTPIVAMTAASRDSVARCFEVGMNDHLPKPISPQSLIHIMNRWLHAPDDQDAARNEAPGLVSSGAGASRNQA